MTFDDSGLWRSVSVSFWHFCDIARYETEGRFQPGNGHGARVRTGSSMS
jgi:hypothetical protein